MQSSNPVFQRSAGFNGRGRASGMSYPGSTQQSQHSRSQATEQYGGPQAPRDQYPTSPDGYGTPGEAMTVDSVVQKTAMTLGIVVVLAAATWLLTGPIAAPDGTVDGGTLGLLYSLSMVGALGGFALAMVNSFKKVVSPALVIAYAALEGVFVGAFSKALEAQFGGGIVMGAVVGTFGAVAGTLAAYKYFNIRVSDKFRKFVVAAVFGFVAVSLLDFVLRFFSADIGINGFGGLGLVMSVIGLALGIFMLILDFDFVERGVAAQLPEVESWRAAFGLTVTIIWIYIELLRILAILRGND